MNRVRKINENEWQVLITPGFTTNSGYEILRGTWYAFDDDYLKGYKILTFKSLSEAQCEAFRHPDIDWDQLVLLHENVFIDLKKIIGEIIKDGQFNVEFEGRLMDSLKLKNCVFDRVLKYGDRFSVSYQMNDIVSFNLVNPWNKILQEISYRLISDDRLRLKKKVTVNGVIYLIGETDVGTTYEIVLWPTLLYQWAKWVKMRQIKDNNVKKTTLQKCLKEQSRINHGIVLR